MDHAVPRNGRAAMSSSAALADVIVAVHARPGGQIERVCFEALDRGQCVLSCTAKSGLVAAGATAVAEADLAAGLSRFLSS